MPIKSLLLALFVVLIWGINFVVIKIGVTEMPPIALLAARYGLAGLILIPFIKWPGWRQFKWCVLQGIFLGVLHQGTLFYALTLLPAGLISIILQSAIILVTLMGWLFFKETIGWRTWLGIALGLIGVTLLIGIPSEQGTALGYIMAIASTFFVSFTYIIMKKIGKIHAPTYIALMSLPVAPIIIIMSLFMEGTEWIVNYSELNVGTIGFVIFYQVIMLSLSHMIWQNLMTKEPISKIMPLTLLIPLVGIVTAVIILGEIITLPMIAGGALTIMGVGIITFRQAKKQAKKKFTPLQNNDAG